MQEYCRKCGRYCFDEWECGCGVENPVSETRCACGCLRPDVRFPMADTGVRATRHGIALGPGSSLLPRVSIPSPEDLPELLSEPPDPSE